MARTPSRSIDTTACRRSREGFSPASRMALRTATVASARVVLFEPRVKSVSPTPTMAYLSRRNFGVVASTSSLGCGISSKLPTGFFLFLGSCSSAPYGGCCIASFILLLAHPPRLRRNSAGLRPFRRLFHPLRIGRDLDACALLFEQHHDARVAPLPAAVARFSHLGIGEIAYPHRHAEFASEVGRQLA